MAEKRIKDIGTTATSTATDDFLAIDGTTNNTRKLSARNPTFSGAVSAGSLSLTTALPLGSGGTGATTQAGAANAVLPSQTSNTGKYLKTDGSNVSWDTVAAAWGSITGTLSSQTDLQNALDAKTNTSIVPNTAPSAGQLLVGNAGGTAYAPVSTSGDVTIASTGATTIGAGKVTNAMLAGSIDLTTKVTGTLPPANGGTGSSSVPSAGQILVGNAGGTAFAAVSTSGDVTVDSTGATTIGAGKVTNSMLAGSIDLTTKVTGALPVANGGTGLTAGTSGGVLAFTASGTIASSSALAANALVVGGGAGVAPSTVTTGTGVVTALGVNTGTAGAFVVNGGALGTPSSGTVTNLTGTASININGTVGATTPNTGAFTTITASSTTDSTTKDTGALVIEGGLGVEKKITTGDTISDASGNVRSIPQNAKTAAYTLVVGDNGKHISITTGGVTVPASVFSAGDVVTIYNNSGSNQTITQGSSATLRQAGTANTGNRTLAQYGVCTVLCVASNTFVISGGGLS